MNSKRKISSHSKRHRFSQFSLALFAGVIGLSACGTDATEVAQLPPTETLAPIVSNTPRFTATLIPTDTARPTETLTPSETPVPPTPSNTFTPSATPQIEGSVNSLQDVNVRSGPNVQSPAFAVLRPGTGFVVLGTNEEGNWFNIRLEDGTEGWISSQLVRLQPTQTSIPSLTPTPDLTLLAQGTPLPTSVIGGQPITPTPPRSLVLAETTDETLEETQTTTSSIVQPPNIAAIQQTATALVSIGIPIVATSERPLGGPTGGPILSGSPTVVPATPAGTAQVGNAVDVLAYCDDRSFGAPAPTTLAAGSTIDIFWSWYASTPELVREHIAAANYDIRLDGERIANWRSYAEGRLRQESGNYYQYWFAPSPVLTAGEHQITYTLTWSEVISDGYADFGPGTGNVMLTGTCTFTVR